MGYKALQEMRKKNNEMYGIDFPKEPRDLSTKKSISNIERACLRFLRESCENLRFDATKRDLNDREGKSAGLNQIPYNMEKDIDRICLETAIHRFLKSGVPQDAFDVYFCYLEMFIGGYGKNKKMSEMLAEFESNASVLLMKHRDHYVHSVYVFILGLAIFEKNSFVSNNYKDYYSLKDKKAAAHHFLKYWGMTALFHDIGYPFELPFEQVKSYFGDTIEGVPFVAYKGIEDFVQLSLAEKVAMEKILNCSLKTASLNEVLATNIEKKFGKEYAKTVDELKSILEQKPMCPDLFNGYMDHAYFSGVIFFRQLSDILGVDNLTIEDLDAVTAIVLHNSMYKFSVTNVKDEEKNRPLDMNRHPLTYLLMLCDELQCWDRVSYGQNSRQELHAMWCDLEFEENAIYATYFYDSHLKYKAEYAKGSYKKMTDAEKCTFLKDIEKIIRINDTNAPELMIDVKFIKNNRRTNLNISSSSFLHLYRFAVALNSRYLFGNIEDIDQKQMEEAFEELSLEYKLSNILQAKEFAQHLDAIGCFYTDKAVAYELLDGFTERQMDVLGPLEHMRWVREKDSMGWHYDEEYLNQDLIIRSGMVSADDLKKMKKAVKELRECTRTHSLLIPDYEELEEEEQNKDMQPMNLMLKLIEVYDGVRIYRGNH